MRMAAAVRWLLPLLLLAASMPAVIYAEDPGPTESECRPYIEKALKQLETPESIESTGSGEDTASLEVDENEQLILTPEDSTEPGIEESSLEESITSEDQNEETDTQEGAESQEGEQISEEPTESEGALEGSDEETKEDNGSEEGIQEEENKGEGSQETEEDEVQQEQASEVEREISSEISEEGRDEIEETEAKDESGEDTNEENDVTKEESEEETKETSAEDVKGEGDQNESEETPQEEGESSQPVEETANLEEQESTETTEEASVEEKTEGEDSTETAEETSVEEKTKGEDSTETTEETSVEEKTEGEVSTETTEETSVEEKTEVEDEISAEGKDQAEESNEVSDDTLSEEEKKDEEESVEELEGKSDEKEIDETTEDIGSIEDIVKEESNEIKEDENVSVEEKTDIESEEEKTEEDTVEGSQENESLENIEEESRESREEKIEEQEENEEKSKEEISEKSEEEIIEKSEEESTEKVEEKSKEESEEVKEEDSKEQESEEVKDSKEQESEEVKEDSKEQKSEETKEDSKEQESEEKEVDSEEVTAESVKLSEASPASEEEAAPEAESQEQKDEESTEKTEGEPESKESTESPEEEDLTLDFEIPENLRPRGHIGEILKLTTESAERELLLSKTIDSTLKELKRVYDTAIKPLELLYKYRDLSNRHFGDPEIFSKPLILFMGPWSGGKSTIINYLLDNEYKQTSLRTGAEPSPAYFNILMYGEDTEILDGTQLAADWTFSGLQKFGQGLLDRLRGLRLPSPLLEKVNIVEIPGILEIRKQIERVFPFNDACQWFIDRADIIFLVYDPSKLDVGPETEAILDQLKGREYQTRIILNKADQVKPEELMRVQGTLIWNISPLMSSPEPPVMYSTSLWSMPYEIGAPIRLLSAQERAFLRDFRQAIDRRVENKISSARRFAVRVRNHAKMVDCYLTTYYNHMSFFGNKKRVSDGIIERPQDYHIYEGLSTLTNISRYDLPDPDVYRDFFRLNALYEFQQLSATCTYFRGCPINRLDVAIAYDLPELVGKYKKSVEQVLAEAKKSQS